METNFASLKTEIDKLDIDKLETVPLDLSKLSDVVKNDVFEKAVHDKLETAKANNIDTSEFVLKTNYQTVIDPVKKTKLTDLENIISDISSLATKIALRAVENKIPDACSLVKRNKLSHKNQ